MGDAKLHIGIDVGSTTVKAVVTSPQTDELLWQDYQRHESKQLEKVLEFLATIEAEFPTVPDDEIRVLATGSGAKILEQLIGAKFVQEVNAVCLAVEKLCPEAGSVVELGGQDAKIIIFKKDPRTGRKKKIPSMNDKCAGGTGAVLDKISAKLGIPPSELCGLRYDGIKLHHVAGKCGVFAETDINSLQLQGIAKNQLMASLFEALVAQNLSVLTRGHTLRPHVLLLGGPNTYIRGMQEAWRANIPPVWEEREYSLPKGMEPEKLIQVPENSQYFAAIGAIDYGKEEGDQVGVYRGVGDLEHHISNGGVQGKRGFLVGLSKSREELETFKQTYRETPFLPATFKPGELVEAFIGLDGGSTSTKAVLMNREKKVLAKSYQLARGNPIEETKEIFAKLRKRVESSGATLTVLGVGVTGYGKDVLKDVLQADVAIVETVAHTTSALHYYKNVDVICDIGGQDIKIMILKDGKVKDFKLNTQCSAGNGYFLQSTAHDLGIPVEEYADIAFQADVMPSFSYGCAVFLQQDIVNFQRQGWKPAEIMAGLAAVLPKNIWLYVAQIPNMSKLGTNFILQGGTQHNLAAVKAQVDFIRSKFRGAKEAPNIIVHEHCGESGAIGAALEAVRVWRKDKKTSFMGLDAVESIRYTATSDEETRCNFCKNKCLRTFIDVQVAAAERRLIVGNSCEKGSVEDIDNMREIKKELDATLKAYPNLAEMSAREMFKSLEPETVADAVPRFPLTKKRRHRARLMRTREKLRIGIPRVLNMYSISCFFRNYFESLGVPSQNIIFSDYTSGELYKEGIKRGAIDPCYPSKLSIPHIHNLIHKKHVKKPLDIIFFPKIDDLPTNLVNTQGCRVCPAITATPEAVKAAFTKEGDTFEKNRIRFLSTFLNVGQPALFERQMYLQFSDILGLSEHENARAIKAGYAALDRFNERRRRKAREVLKWLENENRIGIVLLGRPYHNDNGINHDILVEFQKRGYPIFTPDSLPVDEDILDELFGEEVRLGIVPHPLDISDVWKNSFSENSNRKLWAAKFTSRHPNLVALEISNFRCGHDAAIYTVVEEIIENSGTPYFNFKDLDENKPAGSIKIRVETISYFLKRYREEIIKHAEAKQWVAEEVARFERELKHRTATSVSHFYEGRENSAIGSYPD